MKKFEVGKKYIYKDSNVTNKIYHCVRKGMFGPKLMKYTHKGLECTVEIKDVTNFVGLDANDFEEVVTTK